MFSTPRLNQRFIALSLGACATLLVFAPGLAGPFVLDDHVNLAPVWAWLRGQQSLHEAVLGNASGPTGRPLAYLSFAANAAASTSPFGFKLVNVLLHLLTGLVLFEVLRRAVRLIRPAAGEALASMVTVAWWLHPLHVSTVLYVVQRMAIMAALAQLAAILVYLHARTLPATRSAESGLLLFLAFPAIVAAGTLAKETAVLALPLVFLMEIVLFRGPRPKRIVVFFTALLLVPTLLAVLFALTHWADMLEAFQLREFGPLQRLATELRIVWHYVAVVLMPGLGHLGLYRDGFALSHNLLIPWTGPAAGIGWLGVLALATACLRQRPLITLGIGWFLIGHALESSILPLEPYFEHRNYLPAAGLLLAAFAAMERPFARLPGAFSMSLAMALLAALGAATAARSQIWSDLDRLLAEEAPPAPEISRRLQIDRAIRAFGRGDVQSRNAALDALAQGDAGDRTSAALWRAVLGCDAEGGIDAAALTNLQAEIPEVATHNQLSALGLLVARSDRCRGLSRERLAGVVETWQSRPRNRASAYASAVLRSQLAKLAGGTR